MHARSTPPIEESVPEVSSIVIWVQTRSTLSTDDDETMMVKSDLQCMGGLSTTDVKL